MPRGNVEPDRDAPVSGRVVAPVSGDGDPPEAPVSGDGDPPEAYPVSDDGDPPDAPISGDGGVPGVLPGWSEPVRPVTGSLYDGPIEGAAVYVDVNRNRRVDEGDRLIDEATDAEGNFEGDIPEYYRNFPLIADNRGATHHGDSNVDLPPFFVAPAGSRVISPITHIVELRVVTRAGLMPTLCLTSSSPSTTTPICLR